MVNIHNLYFARVYKKSKWLFAAIALFVFFQTYFFLKREYSFPFYVWDMYSHVENVSDTLVRKEIYINGKLLHTTQLTIWQEALINNSFANYENLRQTNFHDPVHELIAYRTQHFSKEMQERISYNIENTRYDTDKFPPWVIDYLEKVTKSSIKELSYKKSRYVYDKSKNTYKAIEAQILFTIKSVEP